MLACVFLGRNIFLRRVGGRNLGGTQTALGVNGCSVFVHGKCTLNISVPESKSSATHALLPNRHASPWP